MHFDASDGFVGGLFWDGRATGSNTMTPLEEQALGPLQADKEHAFSRVCVLWEIAKRYKAQFNSLSPTSLNSIPFEKIGATDAERDLYCHTGTADLPVTPANFLAREERHLTTAYNYVGVAIAAYEASPEVNRFASKWDDVQAGRARFTAQEERGEKLFDDNCKNCHESEGNMPEIFTDHEFYNLGVPRNPLRATLVDRGLGATVKKAAYNGFFRNPGTRNVDKRSFPGAPKTYMHNGALSSLDEVVHFYNTRDTKACPRNVTWVRFPTNADPVSARRSGVCWPTPDFPSTITDRIGDMGLRPGQEAAIVAYLRTMTDR